MLVRFLERYGHKNRGETGVLPAAAAELLVRRKIAEYVVPLRDAEQLTVTHYGIPDHSHGSYGGANNDR